MDFGDMNITDLRVGRLDTAEMGMGSLSVDHMEIRVSVPVYLWCAAALALLSVVVLAVSTVIHHRWLRRRVRQRSVDATMGCYYQHPAAACPGGDGDDDQDDAGSWR